eukprot:TRINITY_DN357_c0_g1_i2.p2 TRINITY_DN357_c0_g1~~TRINITY_DN357_c0_g1_i2.p2  ORF type:complete len:305 (-),score=28.12 TRINITY_DN357_c0_g1_i2:271-1185(-)
MWSRISHVRLYHRAPSVVTTTTQPPRTYVAGVRSSVTAVAIARHAAEQTARPARTRRPRTPAVKGARTVARGVKSTRMRMPRAPSVVTTTTQPPRTYVAGVRSSVTAVAIARHAAEQTARPARTRRPRTPAVKGARTVAGGVKSTRMRMPRGDDDHPTSTERCLRLLVAISSPTMGCSDGVHGCRWQARGMKVEVSDGAGDDASDASDGGCDGAADVDDAVDEGRPFPSGVRVRIALEFISADLLAMPSSVADAVAALTVVSFLGALAAAVGPAVAPELAAAADLRRASRPLLRPAAGGSGSLA